MGPLVQQPPLALVDRARTTSRSRSRLLRSKRGSENRRLTQTKQPPEKSVRFNATGRRYPFRQFVEPNAHGTSDPQPSERLDLSEEELAELLLRYRQSLNLGVEDLARLIGAAEMQAASHRMGPVTAADIMSRDLITVGPDTPLTEVADLLSEHGFTSLPVADGRDRFLGVIFQIHLIRRSREDAKRLRRGLGAAMARLIDPTREVPVRASDIMSVVTPRVVPTTPIAVLLPMLAEGEFDAIPVLKGERIVGIVTRSDLITAMVRQSMSVPKPAT